MVRVVVVLFVGGVVAQGGWGRWLLMLEATSPDVV